MEKINRYPGVQPFTENNKAVFFGRDDDRTELLKYISLENLVVLFGKSGLGKTSLLNAAVLPELRRESNYQPLLIRFNNYNELTLFSPSDIFNNYIHSFCPEPSFIDLIPVSQVSLWQSLKKLQLENAQYESGKFILFMDQFEEFFTYPNGIEDFSEQLADLLNSRIPSEFKKTLRRSLAVDEELQAALTDERHDKLMEPLDVKVVISIRSDKMSLLNNLKDCLPNILANCYELKPLNEQQARSAITKPATMDGDFLSPPFTFDGDALTHIMAFLQKDSAGDKKRLEPVESFQLQIICRFIENKVIEKKIGSQVHKADIDVDLDKVLEQYYDEEIGRLSEYEQALAREFIEDGLILDKEKRRTSLDIGVLRNTYPQVKDELLSKLVNTHILRAEPNSFGTISYELSHDTLVEPVLKKKRVREEEARIKEEAENRLREAEAKIIREKKRQRKIIYQILIVGISIVVGMLSYGFMHLNKAWREAESANMSASVANNLYRKISTSEKSKIIRENQKLRKRIATDSLNYLNMLNSFMTTQDMIVNARDGQIEQLRVESQSKDTLIIELQKGKEYSDRLLSSQKANIQVLTRERDDFKQKYNASIGQVSQKNNELEQNKSKIVSLERSVDQLKTQNTEVKKAMTDSLRRFSRKLDGMKMPQQKK
jgi:hypothetical protein